MPTIFEIVYRVDDQEKKYEVIMIRQYNGKLTDIIVSLDEADMLYDYLRQFRKRWLELSFVDRRGRVTLQSDPHEDPVEDARKTIPMTYRRLTLSDAEGLF